MARADRRFGVSYPGLRRFGKVWDKTVDPLTGEEVVWDGGPGKMFNEAALLRLILKDNEVWRKFYPPSPPIAEPRHTRSRIEDSSLTLTTLQHYESHSRTHYEYDL